MLEFLLTILVLFQLGILSSLLSGGADAEIRLYDLGKNATQLREPRTTVRSKVTIPR